MIEMLSVQLAQTNGIRTGFHEAGAKTDEPPLVLRYGWPDIAMGE